MELDRRSLLQGLAGAAGALAVWRPIEARRGQTPGPTSGRPGWGVQLYTVRDQVTSNAAITLRRIAAIGYTEIEVLQTTLPVVAPLARQHGLAMVSMHLDRPTSMGEGFDALLDTAARHGIRDVVIPVVPAAERPTDRAGFEAVAAHLSGLARKAAAAGLRLGYHNHAFEFGHDRDGTRWIDVLMRGTADAGMLLQLDVFWATIGGAHPVAVLGQYKGRIASLHLKDKHPDAGTTLVESTVPRTAFVEVGTGSLDFPAIITAARAAGARHYFVEQDQTPGDPVESLGKSYAFLAALGAK